MDKSSYLGSILLFNFIIFYSCNETDKVEEIVKYNLMEDEDSNLRPSLSDYELLSSYEEAEEALDDLYKKRKKEVLDFYHYKE